MTAWRHRASGEQKKGTQLILFLLLIFGHQLPGMLDEIAQYAEGFAQHSHFLYTPSQLVVHQVDPGESKAKY